MRHRVVMCELRSRLCKELWGLWALVVGLAEGGRGLGRRGIVAVQRRQLKRATASVGIVCRVVFRCKARCGEIAGAGVLALASAANERGKCHLWRGRCASGRP